jgi:hypothetical protein
MARQPGADPLIEDELGVLMTAVAERHDEDPGAPRTAADRIEQCASAAEINLRLFAWRGVHPYDRSGVGSLQRAHEAADRRVATGI